MNESYLRILYVCPILGIAHDSVSLMLTMKDAVHIFMAGTNSMLVYIKRQQLLQVLACLITVSQEVACSAH